jgi:hypothetical protein
MTTTRRVSLGTGIRPLEGPAYQLAPARVQETSLAYAHARDAFRAKRAEPSAARDAIKAAAARDDRAVLDAARAGRATPAPKEAGKAREQADRLLRETDAARSLAEEKLAVFVDALAQSRAEIDEAAERAVEAIRRSLAPLVDELEANVLRLYGLRSELGREGGLSGRLPVFDPRTPRKLGNPLQGAFDGLRNCLNAEVIEAERQEFLTERARLA